MELPLWMDQQTVGGVLMHPGTWAVDFTLHDVKLPPGLWRIVLQGDRGEVLLGLTETGGLHRQLSGQLLAGAGKLRSARAEKVPVRQSWQKTLPEGFSLPALPTGTLYRKQGECVEAAVAWTVGGPFPVSEYFCFSRICQMQGRMWIVLAFDQAGEPVFPTKS